MATYAGYLIVLQSKLQTEMRLSLTESDYIALSQFLRELIPMMILIQELKEVLSIEDDKTKIHCTIFEDNNSCIELDTCPTMIPRTKHISSF